MGQRKFPVLDEDFELKIVGACKNAIERGLIKLLLASGMHIRDCVDLKRKDIKTEGSRRYVRWARTKTARGLQAPIRREDLEDILAYLDRRRKLSIRQHQLMIRDIGQKAGYEDVSPMTFRHTLCVKLIKGGWSIPEIAQRLGCTQDVVIQNYAILREDQLFERDTVEEAEL
jgi:site-specific recombinase XerD